METIIKKTLTIVLTMLMVVGMGTVNTNRVFAEDEQTSAVATCEHTYNEDNVVVDEENLTISNTCTKCGETFVQSLVDSHVANLNAFTGNFEEVEGVWHIKNLIGLQEFASAVSGGNTFSGKTVVLDADIDMSSIDNWTPISSNSSNGFKGTFDGNGKTISNLTINNVTFGSHVSFFGPSYGLTVKNLTFDNANITGGNDTGVVVGFHGIVVNVTVKNSAITGEERVGAIASGGYVSVKNSTVDNCTVTATEQAGGIEGYICGTEGSGNTVKNSRIIATTDRAGGLFGKIQGGDNSPVSYVWSNNKIENTTVTAPNRVGGVAGQIMGDKASYEIKNNYIDATLALAASATTSTVGTEISPIGPLRNDQSAVYTSKLSENITGNSWTAKTYAENSYTYANVGSGVDPQTILNATASLTEPDHVDVTVSETITVNGESASQEVKEAVETLVNNSAVNNMTADDTKIETAITTANNTLVSELTNVTVDGETVKLNDKEAVVAKTIKLDLKSAKTGTNTVVTSMTFDVKPMITVTNGTDTVSEVIDNNKIVAPITFRLPVDSSVTSKFAEVKHEGSLLGYYEIKTDNGNKYIEVSSSTFSEYSYEILNGETENPVAAIGAIGYATLQAAIAAVPTDGTETIITMIGDGVLYTNSGVTVSAGQIIILNLNGHNLSNYLTQDGASQIVYNKGTLTIKDDSEDKNGSISTCAAPDTVGDWHTTPRRNWTTVAINNEGNLTLDNGKIVSTAEGGIAYAIDNKAGGTLNINGGSVKTLGKVEAIRMFINSETENNSVNISGGLISGSGAVWMQGCSTGAVKGVLNITGGTLDTNTGYRIVGIQTDDSSTYDNIKINVSGGQFTMSNSMDGKLGYPFEIDDESKISNTFKAENIVLTGGTFHKNAYSKVNTQTRASEYMGTLDDLCADGYYAHDNQDGTWTVRKASVINVTPETVQEALDNALDGDTIILAEGNYNMLYLRQTLANSTRRFDLDKDGSYPAYYREFKNLTIKAADGASVNVAEIKAEAGLFWYDSCPASNQNDMESSTSGFVSYLALENIVIDGLNFNATDKSAIVLRDNGAVTTRSNILVDGLTIQNCTGTGLSTNTGVHFFSAGAGTNDQNFPGTEKKAFNNIVIKNNELSNYYQPICMNNSSAVLNGMTVSGNTFTDCTDNVINVTNKNSTGNFIINDNTITNINGRFIRMNGVVGDATFEIKNNTLVTPIAYDGDGDIVKLTAGDNGSGNFAVQETENDWEAGEYTTTSYGYTWLAKGDVSLLKTYVAQIGDTKYETLQDAVNAAQPGQTITLLSDAEGAGIFVGAKDNKNFTIDFNNHTYTVVGPAVGSTGTQNQAFHLEKNNTIVMKNGTISCTSDSGVKMLVQNYSNLTLDGMNLDGTKVAGLYTLSTNNGSTVIKDTTINAKQGGIAFDVCSFGSYTDNKVTVEGNSVINGTIELSKTNTAPIALEIKGGDFTNASLSVAAGGDTADVTKDADASITAPNGFMWNLENKLVKVVAQIGETKYETLADAFAAVENSQTITLLTDCSGNGIIVPSGKNFTVNFNNHSYTVNTDVLAGSNGTKNQAFQLLKDSTITFKNGSIIADNAAVKMIIQNYANLTLDNMVIDATQGTNSVTYAVSTNNGISVIKNTKITAKDGEVAFDVCSFGTYTNNKVTVDGTSVITGKVELSKTNTAPIALDIKSGNLENASLVVATGGDSATVTKAEAVTLAAPYGFKWEVNAEDGTCILVELAKATLELKHSELADEGKDVGTLTGGGNYHVGDQVTVIAEQVDYWNFVGWFKGTNKVSTELKYSFTLNGDTTLVAKYQAMPNPQKLTIKDGSGLVKYVVNHDSGKSKDATSEDTTIIVNNGATITLTAISNGNGVFVAWVDGNGYTLTTSEEYSFTMTSDKTVKAKYLAPGEGQAVVVYGTQIKDPSGNMISNSILAQGTYTTSDEGVEGDIKHVNEAANNQPVIPSYVGYTFTGYTVTVIGNDGKVINIDSNTQAVDTETLKEAIVNAGANKSVKVTANYEKSAQTFGVSLHFVNADTSEGNNLEEFKTKDFAPDGGYALGTAVVVSADEKFTKDGETYTLKEFKYNDQSFNGSKITIRPASESAINGRGFIDVYAYYTKNGVSGDLTYAVITEKGWSYVNGTPKIDVTMSYNVDGRINSNDILETGFIYGTKGQEIEDMKGRSVSSLKGYSGSYTLHLSVGSANIETKVSFRAYVKYIDDQCIEQIKYTKPITCSWSSLGGKIPTEQPAQQ